MKWAWMRRVRAARDTDEAVPAEGALRVVAGLSVFGALFVWAQGQARSTATPAAIGLLTIALVSLALSFHQPSEHTRGGRVARAIALFAIGCSASVASYFFGPHTEFGAVLSLALMLLGVASTPGRQDLAWLPSWAGCVALVFGPGLVATLLASGAIPDDGLVPMLGPDGNTPVGFHFAIAAFVLWNLLGFIAARRFRERYHQLAMEVDEATRAAAVRAALLEEARHEYMRALESGRSSGARAPSPSRAPDPEHDPDGPTVRTGSHAAISEAPPASVEARVASPTLDKSTAERKSPPEPARSAPDAERVRWAEAHAQKLRIQAAFVVLGCIVGGVATLMVVTDPVGRVLAVVGLSTAGAMPLLHGWLLRRRASQDTLHWPWVVVGVASALVAAAFGIHGILSSFIVVIVFLGGVFRGNDAARGFNRRSAVLAALCTSYLILFLLLYLDVIPDFGVVPLRGPHMREFGPVLHHVLLQGAFIASFLLSGSIDRRYRALRDRVVRVAEDAAAQEALLADASAKLSSIEAELSAGLFVGERVGRFTLTTRRASGGMGDVYDAVRDEDGTRAAVKLVRVDVVSEPAVLALFSREVDALRRVESPYVARVLDAGGLDVGLPYVAMELIEGPSLNDILRAERRLEPQAARRMSRDVLLGLAALHSSRVVHRDIKPRNLLRAHEGADAPWKIVDLGVAHIGGAPQDRDRFAVVGTPRYMAPEQFQQGALDGRADLYAFALVLYRALTGRPGFGRERRTEDGRFLSPPDPQRFASMRSDVSMVLRVGSATRAEDRYASAETFLEALEAAFDGELSPIERARAARLLVAEPWRDDPDA